MVKKGSLFCHRSHFGTMFWFAPNCHLIKSNKIFTRNQVTNNLSIMERTFMDNFLERGGSTIDLQTKTPAGILCLGLPGRAKKNNNECWHGCRNACGNSWEANRGPIPWNPASQLLFPVSAVPSSHLSSEQEGGMKFTKTVFQNGFAKLHSQFELDFCVICWFWVGFSLFRFSGTGFPQFRTAGERSQPAEFFDWTNPVSPPKQWLLMKLNRTIFRGNSQWLCRLTAPCMAWEELMLSVPALKIK